MVQDMRGLTVGCRIFASVAQAGSVYVLSAGEDADLLTAAQQYIADLRACRVRELEEKRINKEMAHIRQKFKGTSKATAAGRGEERGAQWASINGTWS